MTTPETTSAEPKPPTWREIVEAALPDHAHIEAVGSVTWHAEWSTPKGIWTVARRAELMQRTQVKIVGPFHLTEVTDPPADFVVELLRTFGAIA